MTPTAPAPAPEIPEEMVEKVGDVLYERGIDSHIVPIATQEALEAAGVPALLAEAAKAEKLHQVLSWLLSPTRTKHLLDELESRETLLARVKELEAELAKRGTP